MILVGAFFGLVIVLIVIGIVLDKNGINVPESDTITKQCRVDEWHKGEQS